MHFCLIALWTRKKITIIMNNIMLVKISSDNNYYYFTSEIPSTNWESLSEQSDHRSSSCTQTLVLNMAWMCIFFLLECNNIFNKNSLMFGSFFYGFTALSCNHWTIPYSINFKTHIKVLCNNTGTLYKSDKLGMATASLFKYTYC